MTSKEQYQSKVNLINKRLGTDYQICNFPGAGGRCLVVIDPVTGCESHLHLRMRPKEFLAYLQGMIQATTVQQRIYQTTE